MKEIEAKECYKAIGVLLAHIDSLEGKGLSEHRLKVVESVVKKYLPCEHEEYTILDNIHCSDEYEVEIRIQCDNCSKLGVKVYSASDIISWDS